MKELVEKLIIAAREFALHISKDAANREKDAEIALLDAIAEKDAEIARLREALDAREAINNDGNPGRLQNRS